MTNSVLDATERADPRGHAVHVAAAVAWGFLQSVTNAGEGIAWGILVAVALARLPATWRCYRRPLRDPVWCAFMAWTAWMCVGLAWAPAFEPGAGPAFSRWTLTPLALWPVMSRPWAILAAVGIGTWVQVAATLVLSWNGSGWNTYLEMQSFSAFGQLQWQLHCAAMLAAAGLRWLPWPGRVALLPPFLASVLCVGLTAGRAATASLGAGLCVVALRPPGWARVSWTWGAAIAALLAACAWAITTSPVAERIREASRRADQLSASGLDEAAASRVASERLILAHAAIDIAMEHPIRGGGHGQFVVRLPQWALGEVAAEPAGASVYGPFLAGDLTDAHNAYLQAWVDGGIPAVAFLATGTIGLGWRLWRQSRGSALAGTALALYATILVGIPVSIATAKAPGAIIAICLAIGWLGASAPDGLVRQRHP